MLTHPVHHFARDRIGFETATIGQGARPLGAKGVTVVGIEVPLPAFGLAVGRHEHAVALALFAVKEFQAQLFAEMKGRIKEYYEKSAENGICQSTSDSIIGVMVWRKDQISDY